MVNLEATGNPSSVNASANVTVNAVAWREHVLELIDQRVLPLRFETVYCADATQTAEAIRAMVVRGAPAIGCAAAFGIAAEAWRKRSLNREAFAAALDYGFKVLAASRPTAINLAWAMARMRGVLDRVKNGTPAAAAEALEAEALRILDEDLAVNRAIGAAGAGLIAEGASIMTHCNTGALATAGHGTALGVIRSAHAQGKRLSVIANETRPFLQGARLTAWELLRERIPVALATDGMAGHLMKTGKVDLVIVGADRIAANGDTANKIGTYTLAVLAARHRIPFYVAAPLSTFDLSLADGSAIPIEERDSGEVTGFGGVRWAPEGVSALNPAFDVTPADLITGIVTERGIAAPPNQATIAALFEGR